ncbi:proton channel OTOP2 [Gouania willdenowi]|uniref:Otopetrin 2 n=1 Tax=Gouania willdenowi TaxID=441366 RepID=A0A8C5H0K3_GOUWI|nr:proton channel OTOP2 [Gouania willdenowi]
MCLNTSYGCFLSNSTLCEPCRMTDDKRHEMEDAHLSKKMNEPKQLNVVSQDSSAAVGREEGRNWGWMLSGVICLNILLLGCALVSGSAYHSINIGATDLQVYLIILVLLTTIWMSYYIVFTARKENAVFHRDGHAGPVWLRGGLVLFGILSIIMDIFKIAGYAGYLHCDSAVKVVFPVVQLVFIIVQTYFMWMHAKDCIQLQRNISRCGLMLTLSTNLVLWMTAVTEESVHQTTVPHVSDNESHSRSLYVKASYGDDSCHCSHGSCSIFKEAYYYLYPFNIEYSLFASAMAYVMWKNVGRVTIQHGHHHIKFSLQHVIFGPVFGVILVAAGLATFIVYEIELNKHDDDEHKKDQAVMIHFIVNIVIVTLMSIASVIGGIVYKLDQREHVSDKNPTRSLDVGLLVGASLGQFIISYYSIVAMVGTGAKGHLNRLNLAWGILMVIQLGLQNFFIIEGLHREAFHEVHSAEVLANPYVMEPGKDPVNLENGNMDLKKTNITQNHTTERRHMLLWKRRVLKEVCVFLILGNVILWIMPAFGARPQFDHDTETEFYKFNMWAAVVNVGLPFGIFYRMHSVASLFEVFSLS